MEGWYDHIQIETYNLEAKSGGGRKPPRPWACRFCSGNHTLHSRKKNWEYIQEIGLLIHKGVSKNWPRLTDYAIFVINEKQRGQTGYSAAEIFF